MRIKVSLTTEEGEVLDQFIVESKNPGIDTAVQFADVVRGHLEFDFETEDVE